MKRFFLSLIFLGLTLSFTACSRRDEAGSLGPDAPPDAVPDIVGEYVVNGFDPLGGEYSGHLTITAGEISNQYDLQWIVTGSIQEGTGLLEGNQLLIEWHAIESLNRASQGKAVFTVTANGELYGTRTVEGYSGEGTETAYPNQ